MQQRSLFSGEEPESSPIADALARHGWRITGQRVGMDGEVEFRITGRAQRGTSTIWRREALWKTRAAIESELKQARAYYIWRATRLLENQCEART